MSEETQDVLSPIEKAEFYIDRYQYDLAAVLATIALAKTLETVNEIERVKLAQLTRIATALELVAGKRGVIYTRDANGI